MLKKLEDIVVIRKTKSGETKVSYDINREANIYKFLKENGYCLSKLNNRKIYYKRKDGDIIPTNIGEIRDFFRGFLNEMDFEIPLDIDYLEVLNWELKQNRIKENNLLKEYLKDDLNDNEKHIYSLKTNYEYKHQYEIEKLLEFLNQLEFKKSCDKIGTYCTNNPLFYKRTKTGKYIVINYFNHDNKKILLSGFDCWISSYRDEKDIGNKHPKEFDKIKLSFDYSDINLIEEHLE